MLSLILIFIILLGIVFILIIRSDEKGISKKAKISGWITNKITKNGIEGVEVYLGKLTANNNSHSFIKESKYCAITNKEGMYCFENVEIKNYWIMAEYNGKKALKMLKMDDNYRNLEEINLVL